MYLYYEEDGDRPSEEILAKFQTAVMHESLSLAPNDNFLKILANLQSIYTSEAS